MTPIPKTDISTVHLIIKSVLIIALVSVIAGCLMSWHGDKEIGIELIGITSATGGGLVGFLVRPFTDGPKPGESSASVTVTSTTPTTDPATDHGADTTKGNE